MEQKREKAVGVLNYIKRRYTHFMRSHYSHRSDYFRTLITVLLSQRTREEVTLNKDRLLFEKLHLKLDDFLNMDAKEIESLIKPVGFYREKARKIKLICKILKEEYKGGIPKTREELMKLPGIGKKSADVVLNAMEGNTIAVDVHVNVISKRLGIVNQNADYDEIEEQLNKIFRPKERRYVNLGLVIFGKKICLTSKPKCKICPFKNFCKYYNIIRKSK